MRLYRHNTICRLARYGTGRAFTGSPGLHPGRLLARPDRAAICRFGRAIITFAGFPGVCRHAGPGRYAAHGFGVGFHYFRRWPPHLRASTYAARPHRLRWQASAIRPARFNIFRAIPGRWPGSGLPLAFGIGTGPGGPGRESFGLAPPPVRAAPGRLLAARPPGILDFVLRQAAATPALFRF